MDYDDIPEEEDIEGMLEEIENTSVELFSHIDSSELYGEQELPPLTYGTQALYSEFFENEKTLTKFIKNCVRYARTAGEYRRYMNYLIENMNFDSCYFFSKLSLEESKIAGLEIHHYPFTIYDICEIITIKKINNNERLTMFAVAHEALKLHYQNKVGLVPLSKTLHEMAHDGQLYIPISSIFGKWVDFINEYQDFLQDHHKEKLGILYESALDNDANIERTKNSLRIIPQLWINRENDKDRLLTKMSDVTEEETNTVLELDVNSLFDEEDENE